jgi:hypothetical protein
VVYAFYPPLTQVVVTNLLDMGPKGCLNEELASKLSLQPLTVRQVRSTPHLILSRIHPFVYKPAVSPVEFPLAGHVIMSSSIVQALAKLRKDGIIRGRSQKREEEKKPVKALSIHQMR